MSDEKSGQDTAPQEPSLSVVEDTSDNDLIGNPDALEWANRFCMRLDGGVIKNTTEEPEELDDDDDETSDAAEAKYLGLSVVNIGSMLPWFAGAIETGRMVGAWAVVTGALLYEVEGVYHVNGKLKTIIVWVIARSGAEARENFMWHCHQANYDGPLFRKATVRSTGHMPLVIR